ncbi:MAG: hypothetical protein ACT4OT_07520 [Acidobacteriota bacterium]
MIICPACGSSVEGQLCLGCPACGARAVGPPLAKPEHQLVSFGPAALAALGGGLMLVGFLASTTVVWVVSKSAALNLGTIVAAGQTAAWQLKWFSVPVAIAVIWGGSRSLRTIRKSPADFGGLRLARGGFSAAILATLIVATLIGVTVPERLRRRQWGIEAAEKATAYTLSRAMLEYRELHGKLPPQDEVITQLRTLPDPDGSIAEALQIVPLDGYEATTVLAAASKSKTIARGTALRNVSMTSAADAPSVSFTNYQLRLPGSDKKMNTEDDLIIRDGLVMTVAEFQDYKTRTSAP